MRPDRLHEILRRYLLDTASDTERAEVERLLAEREDVREALERERARLAVLDTLPEHEPSRDLAAAVDARLARGEARPESRAPRWQVAIPIAAVALIAITLALPALSRAREAARRASSQNNLKQLALVMKMYAGEHGGQYPPLAPYEGVWLPDLQLLIPEYVSDVSVFFNPSQGDAEELEERLRALLAQEPVDWEQVHRVASQHYVYPGWIVHNAEELPEFLRGVRRLARNQYSQDIVSADHHFVRLKEGVERFMITDINNPAASTAAQSTIPIMFERIAHDRPAGINVLYMDGHVAFIELDRDFPASSETQKAFPPPPLEVE